MVFINDLPDAIKNKLIKLFADDAKLYNVSTSLEDCAQLQQNLDSLIKWSSEWSLRVNPEKCKVLHLIKDNQDRKYKYHMQVEDTETYLEEVPYQKDLGNLSYDERLRILGLPTLEYRRLRADMIQVFKIFKGFDRVNVNAFFEVAVDKRTRGHKYKILKQRFKSILKKYSFSCRVVDSWNGLPDYGVDAPNINSFKNRLNSYWKNYY